MSFERAKMPNMCDAVMFHNEDRPKAHHPACRQPDTAFKGLEERRIIPGPDFQRKYNQPSGMLYSPNKGYTHTGANMGVNYKIPQLDPNWHRPVYGNSKPQMLNYSTSMSNLLSKY